MKREINISRAMNVPATLAKVTRLANRAANKHLEYGYNIHIEERNDGRVTTSVLVIEGEPARYNGWTFVAKVEIENGGLVVTGSPYYEGPAWDRDTFVRNACDHCGRVVNRRKYVIVERDGVRKQVGTACVKDFLGQTFVPSYFRDDFAEIEEGYGGGATGYDPLTVLGWTARLVSAHGYKKSGELAGTRDAVMDLMNPTSERAIRLIREIGHPTQAEWQEAEAALAWAREMPGHSDYALNIRTILSGIVVADRRLGMLVSVIPSYRRHIAQEQIKEDRPSAPAPAGRVVVSGVVAATKWQDNGFGGSLKMLVEADAGYRVWTTVPRDLINILVTDSSGWQELREVTVGERVEFTVTLKPSDDDATFAFGSRPTKARVLEAA